MDRLLAETAEGADALPLLALTLERLYRDFGADGDLTVAEYESMGGMAEVVQNEVDKLLAADPEQRQAQLDALHDAFIPWLATINPDNNEPMRRLARWNDLPAASHPLSRRWSRSGCWSKTPATAQSWSRSPWKACCANGANWPPGCATKPRTSKTPTAWSAPPPTGRPTTATRTGCWKAPAWPKPRPSPPNPVSTNASPPPATTCAPPATRENQRIEAENQRQQAELQAARDKARAAALRKRSRILAAALTVFVLVTVLAVVTSTIAFVQGRELADKNRQVTALRLVAEAQSILAGARSGGQVRAVQQLLAAQAFAPNQPDGALLDAVTARHDVLSMIGTTNHDATRLVLTPDGQRVVFGDSTGTVRAWTWPPADPLDHRYRAPARCSAWR